MPRAILEAGEPLNFRLSDLTAPQALEVGQWWGLLNPAERASFARYFGLWCAFARWSRNPR
jgi:hypothetical protein